MTQAFGCKTTKHQKKKSKQLKSLLYQYLVPYTTLTAFLPVACCLFSQTLFSFALNRFMVSCSGKGNSDDTNVGKGKGGSGKGDANDDGNDNNVFLTLFLSFALNRFMVLCSDKGNGDDGKGMGGFLGKGDEDDDDGRRR
jgi:hypothetical protein